MPTSQKKAEVVLGSDNYLHWEFAMRMTLVLDRNAQGVSVEPHTKIRSATSAMQAWNTLIEFYNRTTMHSRVTMTRRLHEFKMEDGSTMARHLDKFGELIEKKESSERALKATSFGGKCKNEKFGKVGKRYDRKGNDSQRLGEFTGKCFGCGQVGHMKRECPEMANGRSHEDSVFAVGEDRSAGWLIDSGVMVHIAPHRVALYEYSAMSAEMNVPIADGKKIRVARTGSVRLKGIDGKSIRMVEVLHIPASTVDCSLWGNWQIAKYGKVYVLGCHQDTAYYTEYAGVDSEWELWHARMGHLNEDSLEKTQQVTTGMPKTRPAVKTLCGGCMKGKQTVTHFPS
ncbi:polyprotein [Phytophthora megakarya]|uniref:Polyprotein n=1 Tax=Phytophthora megakarya TaxID=4795 RepID=A0A225VAC5_9STRA|nr:polyprotein [Phytophthora megakarya]